MRIKRLKLQYIFAIILPYLIAFLLLSLCVGFILFKSTQSMKNEIINANAAAVSGLHKSTVEDIERARRSSLNTALLLYQQQSVEKLPFQSSHSAAQIHRNLVGDKLSSPVYESIYAFLFNTGEVITTYVSSVSMEQFYGSYFTYGDLSAEEFESFFTATYYNRQIISQQLIDRNGVVTNATMIAQSLPCNSEARSWGVFLYVLDNDYLTERAREILSYPESVCISFLRDGTELVTVQGEASYWTAPLSSQLYERAIMQGHGVFQMDIGGQEMLVHVQDDDSRLITVSASPMAYMMSGVRAFQILMLAQVLVITGLVFVLVAVVTKRSLGSMQPILETGILTHQPGQGVFTAISNSVNIMLSENVQLSELLDEHRERLRQALVLNLVNGAHSCQADQNTDANRVGITLDSVCYTAFLIRLTKKPQHSIDELVEQQQTIFERLIRHSPLVLAANYGSGMLACIICTADRDSITPELDLLMSQTSVGLGLEVFAGSTVNQTMHISRSFSEALIVAQYTSNASAQSYEYKIYWYANLYRKKLLYNYHYNLFTEQKMINQIIAGNESEVVEMMNEIRLNNSYSADARQLRCAIYDLYRLAIRVLETQSEAFGEQYSASIGKTFDIASCSMQEFDQYCKIISQLCCQAAAISRSNKKSANVTLLEKVNALVEENYTDSQMSVSSLSEMCGVSEKYLSHFYKDQTNERLSAYIEKLRIKHASQLLLNESATVAQISQAVGYASAHTFRSAFKKNTGLTPGEYQKSKKQFVVSIIEK